MSGRTGLHFAVFGRGLVSTWRDGAATSWRALLSALYDRGHRVTFFERHDAEREARRDLPDPMWGRRQVWSDASGLDRALATARSADVVIQATGACAGEERALEEAVLGLRRADNTVLAWDLGHGGAEALANAHRWDAVVTAAAAEALWRRAGAREVMWAPPSFDPGVHRPPGGEDREGIVWMGARCPADEAALSRWAPGVPLVLAGAGWEESPPEGCSAVGHVGAQGHRALLGGARAVLHLRRAEGSRTEPVPARLFEAAGCGGCVVAEPFPGLETLFEPGREVLVARDPSELAEVLDTITPEASRRIGRAARARALAEHTNDRLAARLERMLAGVDRAAPLARAQAARHGY